MKKRNPPFPAEVRERAVRMVLEHGGEHPTQWAAISSVAGKIGCTRETLRSWVRQAERDRGLRPGPTAAGCGAEPGGHADPCREFRGLWRPEGLAADAARGVQGRALHGSALRRHLGPKPGQRAFEAGTAIDQQQFRGSQAARDQIMGRAAGWNDDHLIQMLVAQPIQPIPLPPRLGEGC